MIIENDKIQTNCTQHKSDLQWPLSSTSSYEKFASCVHKKAVKFYISISTQLAKTNKNNYLFPLLLVDWIADGSFFMR